MRIDADLIKKLYYQYEYDLFDEGCNLQEHKGNDTPLISFMMTTFNDDSLLNACINSLLQQSFLNWELVVLDNSDKTNRIWDMLQRISKVDKRIRPFKEEKNVGWPKGASICLERVKGVYTTFLAQDDCIMPNVLPGLCNVLEYESPDVAWVGNTYVVSSDKNNIRIVDNVVSDKLIIYEGDNRSDTIFDIMNRVYYNSFFHYMKVSFLREKGIDFFKPYYGDCAGMTHCLSVANKMVVYNDIVYSLTLNTSQTVGRYTWNSYQDIFANQWRSIREVYIKEGYSNGERIGLVSNYVLKNLLGNIACLCSGSCRDAYMHPMEVTMDEIITELEKILSNAEILEMMQLNEYTAFPELLEAMMNLKRMGNISDESFSRMQSSMLWPLLCYCLDEGFLTKEEKVQCLLDWCLQEENAGGLGYYYTKDALNQLSDIEFLHLSKKIKQLIEKMNS